MPWHAQASLLELELWFLMVKTSTSILMDHQETFPHFSSDNVAAGIVNGIEMQAWN
jgi:hypothetical protein